jgi:hypothetical protein
MRIRIWDPGIFFTLNLGSGMEKTSRIRITESDVHVAMTVFYSVNLLVDLSPVIPNCLAVLSKLLNLNHNL